MAGLFGVASWFCHANACGGFERRAAWRNRGGFQGANEIAAVHV